MLYLLDANTLINAKRDYYQVNRVPEFWDWLVFCGLQNKVKIPVEIYGEFKDKVDGSGQKDELALWADKVSVKEALLFEEQFEVEHLHKVLYQGYVPEPTEADLERVGQDPFLISYALSDVERRCIVTAEVSKPKRQGASRHVPDVCNQFSIRWCNLFTLINELNFTTSWRDENGISEEEISFF